MADAVQEDAQQTRLLFVKATKQILSKDFSSKSQGKLNPEKLSGIWDHIIGIDSGPYTAKEQEKSKRGQGAKAMAFREVRALLHRLLKFWAAGFFSQFPKELK